MLGLAAVTALFFLAGPALVLRGVVEPSAQGDRPAWQVQHFAGERPSGPALRHDRAAADQAVLLAQPDSSLTAYGLLRVAQPGEHTLFLECDDYGSVLLDGLPLLRLSGVAARNVGWVKVELGPGPHLLRVDLHNGPGEGFFSLKLRRPGQDRESWPRPGELVRPDLGNVDAWWRLLQAARDPGPGLLIALAAPLLLLALPLARRPGWQGAAAVLLAATGPALFICGPPHKFPFAYADVVRELQQERPDYVFIGNSMVDSALDFARLERLTGGGRSKALTMGGSRSAVHFLFFKNVLLASGARPRAAFLVFRDNYLTNPLLRSQGEFQREVFESLSQGEEPLLERLVHARQPLGDRLARWIPRVFPVIGFHRQVREELNELASTLAHAGPGARSPSSGQEMRDQLNHRFGMGRLRPQQDEAALAAMEDFHDALYDPERYLDFDQALEASFLPHFVRLAREHGLRLVFVRHQRRPGEDGRPPGDAKLDLYMQRLAAYLAGQGMGFHDFTGDPDLPLDLYGAGDHIADEAAERYTEVFFRRLRHELLPLSPPPAPH